MRVRDGLAVVWSGAPNRSEFPVEIVDIEPIGLRGVPDVIRIDSIGVIVESQLPGGAFSVYPPAMRFGGRCRVATVLPPSGTTILPRSGERGEWEVVVRFTATGPGQAGFRALQVIYRHGFTVHTARIRGDLKVEVQEGAPPRELWERERRCIGRAGVESLTL